MNRNVDIEAPEDVLTKIIQEQIDAATVPDGAVDLLWHTFLATRPTPTGISAEVWAAQGTRDRWHLLLETLRHSVQNTPADVCFEVLMCKWGSEPENWGRLCPTHTFADVAAALLDPNYVEELRALNATALEIADETEDSE